MSSTQTVRVVMQQVTKTSTEWDADENLIRRGVICVELDAAADAVVGVKVGVGDKTFANLGYVTDPQLGTAAVADVDDFDPAGTAAAAVLALVADASPAGDTLAELEARIAAVEALGSLATDAELVAAVAALIGAADVDGDTLGELQALIGARLAASANLGDVASPAAARANLDVYDTAAVDAAVAAVAGVEDRAVTASKLSSGVAILTRANRLLAWDMPDRPDGPLGVSDSGHTWITSETEPWEVSDGKLKPSYPGNGNLEGWAILDGCVAGVDCFRIRANNERATWTQGVILAWQDVDNFIIGRMSTTESSIVAVVDGVSSTLGASGNPGSARYPGAVAELLVTVDRPARKLSIRARSNAGDQWAFAHLTDAAHTAILDASTSVGVMNQHPHTRFYDLCVWGFPA